MTTEQDKIMKIWIKAGLIQPSKYWPFEKHSVRQLSQDRKQQLADKISAADKALL